MKARELLAHFRSLNGGWMDLERTVDTFKAGETEAEVRGIAVGWMSYRWALEKAIGLGCNVFVTHEPTYYDHQDTDESVFRFESARRKKAFIERSGLVILRCHDLWDRMPEVGIPAAWGRFLDLGDSLAGEGYFRVYDVAGRTAGELAGELAQRLRALGQDAVQLVGPPEAPVARLAIGTGAGTPFLRMIEELGADVCLCSDDGIVYWRDAAFAIDAGIPMIVVNHAASEEPGMVSLAAHLRDAFPDVPVHHIPQGCMYRTVGG